MQNHVFVLSKDGNALMPTKRFGKVRRLLKEGKAKVVTEYQEGDQKGFSNTREYVLHRDGYQCQNPNCKNRDKDPILVIHHIDFNRTNNHHSNLISLCNKCHTPANHKGFLKDWQPKLKPFKAETFMTTTRWQMVNQLNAEHTYGYLTKQTRFEYGIEKSHPNDAFVIAGGTTQKRSIPYFVKQIRRNNRSLEKFYDATYIDARDGKKKKGAVLFSGRTTRNKEKNSENLRKYRQQKVSKGKRTIRRERSKFQPNDLIRYEGKLSYVAGSHSAGTRVILQETKKSVSIKKIRIIKYGKGLSWEKEARLLPPA